MVKKENLYIKEYVDYYLKLGVDHIFIYDHNDINTEKTSDVIDKSYQKYVTIYENIGNTITRQSIAYTKCYNDNKDKFDWIFMNDIDEYLVIINDSLKNYLSSKIFEDCDFIKIHWRQPTDNDLLHYDKRPLIERFNGPYKNLPHIKTIVKRGIEKLQYDIHSPISSPIRNVTCNNIGKKIKLSDIKDINVLKDDLNQEKAYIIHYKYKSTEEYINKYKRGYNNWFGKDFLPLRIKEYFEDNNITLEKIEYIERELKLNLYEYKQKLKKTLLISIIENYNWEIIEPFFESFKSVGIINNDCVMFVRNIEPETINKIKSFGVKIIEIRNLAVDTSLINYRWKLFRDFLSENQDKYNIVFSADVRDTFFQKDVFKYYENQNSFLGISIEDGILSEPANKDWLVHAYGEEVFQTIQKEAIINFKTVWGTSDQFLYLSKKMWEILGSEKMLKLEVNDQAIGNYLIYYEKFLNEFVIKSENKNGPVMTIGISKDEDIKLDAEKNIINGQGEIAAVIHQYDRKPNLIEIVKQKYCSKIK